MSERQAPRLALIALSVAAGAAVTFAQVSALTLPLVAAFLLAATMLAPPAYFAAASVIAIGIFQVTQRNPIVIPPAIQIYTTDLLLAVLLLRALLPHKRHSPRLLRLDLFSWLIFGTAVGVLLLTSLRGIYYGNSLVSVIRLSTLLVLPLFIIGFTQLFRERTLDHDEVMRLVAVVVIGFAGYMFTMRGLNRPFESDDLQGGRLGEVIVSSGQILRRDFGFASAFILYPLLALAALARMFTSDSVRFRAVLVVSVGATVLTLIRAELFGLILGALVIILLARNSVRMTRTHTQTLIQASFASSAAAIGLFIASPGLARGVMERALPGVLPQSASASANAEYRVEALRHGVDAAIRHPLGVGFVDPAGLVASGVDPAQLAHSMPAFLLAYGGWPALAGVLAIFAGLYRLSARRIEDPSWAHPFYAAVLVFFIVYGFGASGIAGQPWVAAIFAFVTAFRFTVPKKRSP